MSSKGHYVNYYKDRKNDKLVRTELTPNEPIDISILLETDVLNYPVFIHIGKIQINKKRSKYSSTIQFNDISFSVFEETDKYSKIKNTNEFKKYYKQLKSQLHGLYRDVILSSGSININGSYLTQKGSLKIDSLGFIKEIESLCNVYLDTNALLYHFVYILQSNNIKIDNISWHIMPAVIWELEELGKRKKNIYEMRKAKSAFRDITVLLNLGVLGINIDISYEQPDDKIIRKQIKNSIDSQPIFNGMLKQNFFITFDNMMALAAYAEGLPTIQLNMPLEDSFWNINNVSILLSQLAEIFGTIKIHQDPYTFYLQGDWPGKSTNHWCNGEIRYLSEQDFDLYRMNL